MSDTAIAVIMTVIVISFVSPFFYMAWYVWSNGTVGVPSDRRKIKDAQRRLREIQFVDDILNDRYSGDDEET